MAVLAITNTLLYHVEALSDITSLGSTNGITSDTIAWVEADRLWYSPNVINSTTSTWTGLTTVKTLQDAYDDGNMIVTDSAGGALDVSGTQAISLDTPVSSNFTMTANLASDQTLTLAASNAGAGEGNVAINGDNVTTTVTGASGLTMLSTGASPGPVAWRTSSGFTSTNVEQFTYATQSTVNASSTDDIVTLGSITTNGRNLKIEIYLTGVDNAAQDDVISQKIIQTFRRNTSSAVTSMTSHLDNKAISTISNYPVDVNYTLVVSSSDIILRATNSSGSNYTVNYSISWTLQAGGASS